MTTAHRRFPLGTALALAAAFLLALVPAGRPASAAPAPPAAPLAGAEETGSTPIELPEGPATPSDDELVGGFHEVVFAFFLIFLIVALIGAAAHAGHHGGFHGHHGLCAQHWHHHGGPPSV